MIVLKILATPFVVALTLIVAIVSFLYIHLFRWLPRCNSA